LELLKKILKTLQSYVDAAKVEKALKELVDQLKGAAKKTGEEYLGLLRVDLKLAIDTAKGNILYLEVQIAYETPAIQLLTSLQLTFLTEGKPVERATTLITAALTVPQEIKNTLREIVKNAKADSTQITVALTIILNSTGN